MSNHVELQLTGARRGKS